MFNNRGFLNVRRLGMGSGWGELFFLFWQKKTKKSNKRAKPDKGKHETASRYSWDERRIENDILARVSFIVAPSLRRNFSRLIIYRINLMCWLFSSSTTLRMCVRVWTFRINSCSPFSSSSSFICFRGHWIGPYNFIKTTARRFFFLRTRDSSEEKKNRKKHFPIRLCLFL